jgi:hypothetical protein
MLIHSLSQTRFATPQQQRANVSNHREGLRFDPEAIKMSKRVLEIMESPNYRSLMGDSPRATLLAWFRTWHKNKDTHGFSVDIMPLKDNSKIVFLFRRKKGLEALLEGFLRYTQGYSKGQDVLRVDVPFVATSSEIKEMFLDATEAMLKYEDTVKLEKLKQVSRKTHEDFISSLFSKAPHSYFHECLKRNQRIMQECMKRIFGGNFGGSN